MEFLRLHRDYKAALSSGVYSQSVGDRLDRSMGKAGIAQVMLAFTNLADIVLSHLHVLHQANYDIGNFQVYLSGFHGSDVILGSVIAAGLYSFRRVYQKGRIDGLKPVETVLENKS